MKIYLLIFVIIFSFQNALAQDEYDSLYDEVTEALYYNYLVGLKKVSIYISTLPEELKETGITKEQLQTEAEIRLRRAGLYDEKANPSLWITVSNVKSDGYSIRYATEYSLKETARLERNNLSVYAETWSRGKRAVSEKNRIQTDIRELVGKYVDKFIEDLRAANSQSVKKKTPTPTDKQAVQQKPQTKTTQQDDSPFTATYVGGNNPPTIEIFNDTNRTLYLDLGQGKMAAYTIFSGTSQKITLTEGSYNYKASAPRVRTLEGKELFQKGYVYSWRFTIITVPR